MSDSLTYRCSVCGEEHEGLPDFGFDSPFYYAQIPEAERESRCYLNSDACVIDGEDHFIRAVLQVPMIDGEESFGWGLWTSLSVPNFKRYLELWDAEDVTGEGPYFGWLSNRLPCYPDTLNLKLNVHLQNDGQRPFLELEPTDHPLAIDQRNGISRERAIEMAERLLHPEKQ